MRSKLGITVEEIKTDRVFGLLCHLRPSAGWSDDYLDRKIRAAEDDFEQAMGVRLTPTKIKCEPSAEDTDYDLEESAYPYESSMFDGERWGWVHLRQSPVISVERMVFAYPNVDQAVFTVPVSGSNSWLRLDKKYGRIQLVPSKQAAFASFNSHILSIFSGGRGLPQSIFIDYTAGFTEQQLQRDYSNIPECVKRSTVLMLAADALTPGSFTNSSDGHSQSISFDLTKYREDEDRERRMIRQRLKGIPLVVA